MHNPFFLNNNTVLVLFTMIDKNKYSNVKGIPNRMIDYFLKPSKADNKIHVYKDEKGKPFLKNSKCYISITHSNKIIICALSDINIGVDTEYRRSIDQGCFHFINRLYANYFKINNLRDWVRFECSLKLRNLRLESASKNEILIKDVFEGINFEELSINKDYITFISSCEKIKKITYKYIPSKNILNHE